MTKKEAIKLIKGSYHNAATCKQLKTLKDLYSKVKALDIDDNTNIPDELSREVYSM